MIYIILELKKPVKELFILKTAQEDNQILVWSCIKETKYSLFKKTTTNHYYYTTLQGLHPSKTVNVNTLEDACDEHAAMIENYYYGLDFEKSMFGMHVNQKNKVAKLEVVK